MKRLLFINKYPEIIKEFTDAMGNREIEIDTASNGLEAATWLRQKEYQVIVTGVSLDGYNGEQLITHLNKNFPNTVCIIYTTTISPAQLHFFINERNVFRVFLRPVDFHHEFSLALEEAFEYYDVRVKNQEEEGERTADYKKKQQEIARIRQKMKLQGQAQERFERYVKRLVVGSLREYGGNAGAGRQKELKQLEWKLADLCSAQARDSSVDFQDEAEGLLGQIREKSE